MWIKQQKKEEETKCLYRLRINRSHSTNNWMQANTNRQVFYFFSSIIIIIYSKRKTPIDDECITINLVWINKRVCLIWES